MSRRIFGSRRGEVNSEWRRLPNEELNDLYSSPSIVQVINSRRMSWTGHVARIGVRRGVCRVLEGKPDGDPGVDGRIIRRIFRKWDVGVWGNETSGSIKCGEFLD